MQHHIKLVALVFSINQYLVCLHGHPVTIIPISPDALLIPNLREASSVSELPKYVLRTTSLSYNGDSPTGAGEILPTTQGKTTRATLPPNDPEISIGLLVGCGIVGLLVLCIAIYCVVQCCLNGLEEALSKTWKLIIWLLLLPFKGIIACWNAGFPCCYPKEWRDWVIGGIVAVFCCVLCFNCDGSGPCSCCRYRIRIEEVEPVKVTSTIKRSTKKDKKEKDIEKDESEG